MSKAKSLVIAILAVASFPSIAAEVEDPRAALLKASLLKKAESWDRHALEAIVSGTLSLESELGRPISQQELEAIAAGFSSPSWRTSIPDWLHPKSKEREIALQVHEVRQYLVLGKTDLMEAQRALNQAQTFVHESGRELLSRYPGRKKQIDLAVERVLSSVREQAANPLNREFMATVGADVVDKSHGLLTRLDERHPVAADMDEEKQVFAFSSLLLSSLTPIRRLSTGSTLPHDARLRQILKDYETRISEISRYESQTQFKMSEQARLERNRQRILEHDGATTRAVNVLLDERVAKISLIAEVGADRGGVSASRPGGPAGVAVQQADAQSSRHWAVGTICVLLGLILLVLRAKSTRTT